MRIIQCTTSFCFAFSGHGTHASPLEQKGSRADCAIAPENSLEAGVQIVPLWAPRLPSCALFWPSLARVSSYDNYAPWILCILFLKAPNFVSMNVSESTEKGIYSGMTFDQIEATIWILRNYCSYVQHPGCRRSFFAGRGKEPEIVLFLCHPVVLLTAHTKLQEQFFIATEKH